LPLLLRENAAGAIAFCRNPFAIYLLKKLSGKETEAALILITNRLVKNVASIYHNCVIYD
jgi:hypothetical protein